MFIETVPNRSSPPAVLLRESYRDEQGRAQKRTLANLSKLPDDIVDGLKALLNSPLTKSRMRDSLVTEQLALDSDGIGSAAGSSIGDAGDVVGPAALSWPCVL